MSDLSIQSTSGRGGRIRDALKRQVAHHLWLLVSAALYMTIVLIVLAGRGFPYSLLDLGYFLGALMPPVVAVLLIAVGHGMHHAFHVRPFSFQKLGQTILQDDKFSIERGAHAFFLIVLIPLFSSLFTSFKNAIPHIIPYAYDQSLMAFDRWLHFGHHPWELLQHIM